MPSRTSTLSPDAKEALRRTIRSLRGRLVDQLSQAARSEFRLDVAADKAMLPDARRCHRERLEAWLDEQVRASDKGRKQAAALRERFLSQAIKEAAYTLLHRLVLLRILEHHQIVAPPVLTGGWNSQAYEQEFVHYAGPLTSDDTRGYRLLLETVFAELAVELPGLYGPVGLTRLFPVPAETLREVVETLNDSALDPAWGDDTTLGWVYQYWNDPEREALDAKIAGGGKIEPHEIASKTQMFTERYMVEWLLQNSLGWTWLCVCKKNGWTAEAESVLPGLDARRAEWRKKREAGEVAPDALMPVEDGLESAWKYYVPQSIPDDAIAKAPSSVRELKVLDPACGSGHFLVIAFDLLARMYREEAGHRGESRTDAEIAEGILANNLHGIDIDARAIQIAAAALWLKARMYAPEAKLGRMNLVAPAFRLASLPKDDPGLVALTSELERLGVPRELTGKLVASLAGVDHLGTLLRVDQAIGALLDDAEKLDGPLFVHAARKQRAALEACVAEFLDAHAAESDLGLRLEGEQLAAGLRFVRMVKEGAYDVVVGNPPYQGLSKTAQFDYVVKSYPRGKADLYAAFLERGLELVREGGVSALLTMRGWMFLGQFEAIRGRIIREADLRLLGDVDRGAFQDVPDEVLSTVMSIVRRADSDGEAVAVQPTPLDDRSRDSQRTARKRAALLAQVGRYEFDPKGFGVIEGEPVVYWWGAEMLQRYAAAPKLKELSAVRRGVCTGDNTRFLRRSWEVDHIAQPEFDSADTFERSTWVPYLKGAAGKQWFHPSRDVVLWRARGFELKVSVEHWFGNVAWKISNESCYFKRGVAFAAIGASFSARAHHRASVIDFMGQSVYPQDIPSTLCCMNTSVAKSILESLNPSVHFQMSDVGRLPILPVANEPEIFATVRDAFLEDESRSEPSVEFKSPGPSPWRYAQDWAQRAVDRPEGAPLPPYAPEYDPPAPESHVSFALGVALGRFDSNGQGLLDSPPPDALPAGILFVGPSDNLPDSLQHPASARIVAAWDAHQAALCASKKQSLRDWLRKDLFAFHKGLYENRPIYFPLSSEKRSFVAWVSIHRWADDTLQVLLADHLHPTLRRLEGDLADLHRSRSSSDKKLAAAADKQFAALKKLHDELAAFLSAVAECAERGAPPTDPGCPPRAADAPFRMDLDDGVMINSAALWPLLAPQWSDPKKWWKQLCQAEGKKDYDWSHLARRYFPARVEDKCKADPSLAVAHGCFWKYHPAKAFAWELRLQDEIRPDFTLSEADSDALRARFLADHAEEAAALRDKEMVRRERKKAKQDQEETEPTDADAQEGEADE